MEVIKFSDVGKGCCRIMRCIGRRLRVFHTSLAYENIWTRTFICIRSSEKFLSFSKEIMHAQYFPFYIILSNYV